MKPLEKPSPAGDTGNEPVFLLRFLKRENPFLPVQSLQIDPRPARKEFSGQVAGWSFQGLKPWQAGADEIGEIRGITRLNGSFVNQGLGFKFRKRQVTR